MARSSTRGSTEMARLGLPITMADLRSHFRRGTNILQLLRDAQGSEVDSVEAVLAAYDLQAGTYVQAMKDHKHHSGMMEFASALGRVLDSLGAESFLEAGVGEATTLAHVV